MQELKESCLSPAEAVSLRRLSAGAALSSIPSDHLAHFGKRMLVERHGPTLRLTPLGVHQLKAMPKAVRLAAADPLALLESKVAGQHALQHHRGLVRERQAAWRDPG
jgi:hypothetical protein